MPQQLWIEYARVHRAPASRLANAALAIGILLAPRASLAADEAKAASPPPAEAGAAPQEVVITEKARSHFRAGVNLLQDPDGAKYEEAHAQFKAAYAESPSWKILSNLGIAAMKLEKDGEAIDAFEKYLAEGGDQIGEAEREQTQRDLDTLKASVATLTIRVAPEGAHIVDERITNSGSNITNQYAVVDGSLTVRVHPGNHKITARLSGYENAVWEIQIPAGSSHEHSFELEKPKAQAGAGGSGPGDDTYRPVPLGVWIGAGVTGAFTVGAVVTGALALGKNGKYEEANEAGDPEAENLRNGVKSMNLVTDVMIGGAVVSGAVTAVLYFTRPSVPKESAFRVDPILGPNLAALSLSGKF